MNWTMEERYGNFYFLDDRSGKLLGSFTDKTEAKRVMDCVNACAGIDDPGETIRRARDHIHGSCVDCADAQDAGEPFECTLRAGCRTADLIDALGEKEKKE